ncbi:MAG: hypothetical protein KDD36_09430 [Flavobacteriales bacterium]|nr:hypothetical protein [Flavobacteriales bacterium]
MNVAKNIKKGMAQLTCLFAVVNMVSCTEGYLDVQNLEPLEWNPHLAVPLVNSNLSLADVISTVNADDIITQDSTGFLTIAYAGALSSIQAGQLIPLQDQYLAESFVMTGPDISALLGTGTFSISKSTTYSYTVKNDEELDSIILKSSKLKIQIASDFQHNANIVIDIPKLTYKGVSFHKTIPVQYQGSVPIVTLRDYDLANYKLDLSRGGSAFNEFEIGFSLNIVNSGNPISAGDQAAINISFIDNQFSAIYGYVGQRTMNFDQDSVKLDMFANSIDGTLWFDDPEINLNIHNSYGAEISGTFNILEAYHRDKGTLPITGSGIPNPLVINYPKANEVGESKITTLNINKSTTNIRDIISFVPQYIIHQIDANVNPSGKNVYNFVLDTSTVDVDFEIILPLHGTATGFSLIDTIPFNVDNISADGSAEIEQLLFKLVTNNGFPVDVGVQIYFMDSLYKTLDSLINPYENIMTSGVVDASGKVVSSTPTLKYISFGTERINSLFDASYIKIRANLGTYNNGSDPVKFYADNNLGIEMGAQVKLKVDTKK